MKPIETITFEIGNKHRIKAEGIKLDLSSDETTRDFSSFAVGCKDVKGFNIPLDGNLETVGVHDKKGAFIYIRTNHSNKFEDAGIIISLPTPDLLAVLFEGDYLVRDKSDKGCIVRAESIVNAAEESNDIDL